MIDLDRGLWRAPRVVFACLSKELVLTEGVAHLMDQPFSGAAFDFASGHLVRAMAYQEGQATGTFDPGKLFPRHPSPVQVVDRTARVESVTGHVYDADAHWDARLAGQPFDGLLFDRCEGTPFTEMYLFAGGLPLELREVECSGLLLHRELRTPEGWDVSYAWGRDTTLGSFDVRGDGFQIHVGQYRPGCLTTTDFSVEPARFEKVKRNEAFCTGFPSRPDMLDDVALADFLNIRGRFLLTERIASLGRNTACASVERLHVEVPEHRGFDALERLISAASPKTVSLEGDGETARQFDTWFRQRNGVSLELVLP